MASTADLAAVIRVVNALHSRMADLDARVETAEHLLNALRSRRTRELEREIVWIWVALGVMLLLGVAAFALSLT